MTPERIVRAKAPLRISFCGGGTDVPPYPERYGGCVLSATIDKYAYVSLRQRSDALVNITSLDFGLEYQYLRTDDEIAHEKLHLVQAIVKRFDVHGIDVYIHSDAPPGSGLGSSSSMVVALCAAMNRYLGREMAPYELAELAVDIERNDLGIVGGLQDQYAAVFGGFNYIEFGRDRVVVNPLRLSRTTLDELHYHLLLCYTGGARLSSRIVEQQRNSVVDEEERVMDALGRLKDLTIELKSMLLRAQVPEFGETLHAAWLFKQNLATAITNDVVNVLYDTARGAGAWGGKLLGAGGGGYLLLAVPFTRRQAVEEALGSAGGKVVTFGFSDRGVETWTGDGRSWATTGSGALTTAAGP